MESIAFGVRDAVVIMIRGSYTTSSNDNRVFLGIIIRSSCSGGDIPKSVLRFHFEFDCDELCLCGLACGAISE